MHETHTRTHATIALYHASISWLNFSTPSSVCCIHLLYFMLLFYFLIFLLLHLSVIDLEPFCHIIQNQLVTNSWQIMKIKIFNQECGKMIQMNIREKIIALHKRMIHNFLCSLKVKNLRKILLFMFLVVWQHISCIQVYFNVGQQLNRRQ